MHPDISRWVLQIQEKARAAAMAAADKAEKKLKAASEELAKARAVLRFDSAAAALSDRFRFNEDGAATHEWREGAWAVRAFYPIPRALSRRSTHVINVSHLFQKGLLT
jgi:hypothetical protein